MPHHNTESISESEQMYLLTAAMLLEDGASSPIPLSALAQARDIQPVSANQMVRKLADSGLLTYQPYKGVELTDQGQAIAERILRYRRLWETFLVEKLQLPLAEADALACRIEHLTDDLVAERLATFLGNPSFSPQGRPIPQPHTTTPPSVRLRDVQPGQVVTLLQVDGPPSTRTFFQGEQLHPGTALRVEAIGQHSLLFQAQQRSFSISLEIAEYLQVAFIQPTEERTHA